MLKIYTRKYWVSINNKEWEQVWRGKEIMTDSPPSEAVIFDKLSFDECYELLQNVPMYHIRAGKTFFRKRPKVVIEYDYDRIKHYTHFDTISCKVTYEEIKDASLYAIMRYFSAEETIQYLKERGVTTCPMNF